MRCGGNEGSIYAIDRMSAKYNKWREEKYTKLKKELLSILGK